MLTARRLHTPLAALLTGSLMLVGCGSGGSGSTRSSSTNAVRTGRLGPTVTVALAAAKGGRKLTPAAVAQLPPHSRGFSPHLMIAGTSPFTPLAQRLPTLDSNLEQFWTRALQSLGYQAPAGSIVLVGQSPTSCGSTQVTGTDPPQYCASADQVVVPEGFIDANVKARGPAAVVLLISDLYGQHIEAHLGDTSATPAEREREALCLSGYYFGSLEPGAASGQTVTLGPGDESAVNREIAAEAQSPTVPGSSGTITATQLTAAFNGGIIHGHCLGPKLP